MLIGGPVLAGGELRRVKGLIDAKLTYGNDELVLITKDGMSLRFHEEQLREQGRNTLGVWGMYWVEPDEARRRTDAALEGLARWKHRVRAPIVTTGAGGPNRFTRTPPLDEQLDILAERLAPVARGCRELGLPFGIENHGDYYVSDLVSLCRRVPGR